MEVNDDKRQKYDNDLIEINPFRTAKAASNGNRRLFLKSKPQVKRH